MAQTMASIHLYSSQRVSPVVRVLTSSVVIEFDGVSLHLPGTRAEQIMQTHDLAAQLLEASAQLAIEQKEVA